LPTRKKKSRKQRGSRYCGWGQVGQHRKSGGRGGVGKAGGRKHFWIHTIKYDPERYIHKGFKTPSSLDYVKTINVGEIDSILLNQNKKEELDLTALGIEKLLGRGSVENAITVRVKSYSVKAKEKIELAGGKIIK
jgi:large subunit ribosomal protein L15